MSNLIAYRTIVAEEVRRFVRIWPQTLLPPAMTTSLYFMIFGRLIGDRIGSIGTLSYLEYIVPGVILMSVISNAYANVVASFYSTKFQRHIEGLLASPAANWTILGGYITGGICRGMLVGAIVAAIASLFADIVVYDWGVTLGIGFLTAGLFALAGFINAVFADSFDDISIIPNFVLTPLTYLGGVFYSVSMLPPGWQPQALANPLLYMVNAFRYGLTGVSDVEVSSAFLITGGFVLCLTGMSLWLLHKGIGIKT